MRGGSAFPRWCRCTWRYEEGPSHSSLQDIDPLDSWSHVPSLYEHRGQRGLLPEALGDMSTVDRDVVQHGAADVLLSQPDGWKVERLTFSFVGNLISLCFSSPSPHLQLHRDLSYYLRPLRLPGTGRILHSKPMSSFPVYVPPKLKSSATTQAGKCQQQQTPVASLCLDREASHLTWLD